MNNTTKSPGATAEHHPADAAVDHGHSVHIVPIRVLVTIGAVLLVLTWVTVLASDLRLGAWALAVALLIAVVKGSLVVLYFMHLRYDRPINAIVFITALVFVALFVGLAMMDSFQYQGDLFQGEPPGILRQ